jgi:hypothetical protein
MCCYCCCHQYDPFTSAIRRKLRSCRFRQFRQWLQTPSVPSTIAWIVITCILASPGIALSFFIECSPEPPLLPSPYCYELSYIPTILAGIAGLIFALVVFIAESMRARQFDQVSRSGLRRSLLFPLTVSTLAAFCLLLVWHRDHNIALGALPFAIGLMAIASTYHLLQRFWNEEQFDRRDLPVVDTLELLFFSEALHGATGGRALSLKLPWWNVERLKANVEKEFPNFIRSALRQTEDAQEDGENYVVCLGRFIGELEKSLETIGTSAARYTYVPHLVSWYTRYLIHSAPDDMKWLDERHIGYLPVLNTEFAFALRNAPQFGESLGNVTRLYWKRTARDEIVRKIWHWLNEEVSKPIEGKLFERGKAQTDYDALVPYVEGVFKAYEDLLIAAYKERDEKNFPKIASAYSRSFSEFVLGGFGADFDVEHEAEGARYRLEHDTDLTEAQRRECESAIALDETRKRLELSKWEMPLVFGTKIFDDVIRAREQEEREKLNKFLDTLRQYLPEDFSDLLAVALGLSDIADDKWQWTWLHMPESDEIEGVKSWSSGSVGAAASGLMLYHILRSRRVIPENLHATVSLAPGNHYRVQEWVELLTKLQAPEGVGWMRLLTDEDKQRIAPLKAQLEQLQSAANQAELQRIREQPTVTDAEVKFRDAVMDGYKVTGTLRHLLDKLGIKEKHSEKKKYDGEIPAYGLYETHPKETFFHAASITHFGKSVGEMMKRTEDKIIVDAIVAQIPNAGTTVEQLFDLLGTISRRKNVVVILDRYAMFHRFSSSPQFKEKWIPRWQIPKEELPEESGRQLDGFLQIGKRKFPLYFVHMPEPLQDAALVVKEGAVGTLEYLTPRRDKKAFKDATTAPLLVRSVAYSEDTAYLEKLLADPKFFSDIASAEDKRSRALELVEIETEIRAEFHPDMDGIRVFRFGEEEEKGDSVK